MFRIGLHQVATMRRSRSSTRSSGSDSDGLPKTPKSLSVDEESLVHSCLSDECFGELHKAKVRRQYSVVKVPSELYCWSPAHECALKETLFDTWDVCADAFGLIKQFIDLRGYILCFRKPLVSIGTLCVHWYLSAFQRMLFYSKDCVDTDDSGTDESDDRKSEVDSAEPSYGHSAASSSPKSSSVEHCTMADSSAHKKHKSSTTVFLEDLRKWKAPHKSVFGECTTAKKLMTTLLPISVYVIGARKTGKSCLIERFVSDSFFFEYTPTPLKETESRRHVYWMGGLPFLLEFKERIPSRAMGGGFDSENASIYVFVYSGDVSESFEEIKKTFYRMVDSSSAEAMRRKVAFLVCAKGDGESEFAQGEVEQRRKRKIAHHWAVGTGFSERIGHLRWNEIKDTYCKSWDLPFACVSALHSKGVFYLFQMAIKELWFKSQKTT